MRYLQASGFCLTLLACMNCSHVHLNYQQAAPGQKLITSRVLTEATQSTRYSLSIEPTAALLKSGQWQDFKVSLKNTHQTQQLSPRALNWQVSAPRVFNVQHTGRGQALDPGRSVVKVQLKNQPHMQAYSMIQVTSEIAETPQKSETASTEAPQSKQQPTSQSKASAEPRNTPPSGPPVPERVPRP